VRVTPHPTAEWTAQQIVECCGWDCEPQRSLIHDRYSCCGTSFDRRVRNLGIVQACTPFRSPRANAIAERWVRSIRTECLDQLFIFNQRHLEKVLAVRLDNVRPAHRRYLRLVEALKLERSLQIRCLEVSIMFISGPLDVLHQILAPYRGGASAITLWPQLGNRSKRTWRGGLVRSWCDRGAMNADRGTGGRWR
jgi:hypothetical protein